MNLNSPKSPKLNIQNQIIIRPQTPAALKDNILLSEYKFLRCPNNQTS